MHDLWWATMRKAMLLNRKPGQGLAVTKDGAKMHLGGRPQKQYSPIMGRDLNKFLAGIASQQERSVIGHSRTRDY